MSPSIALDTPPLAMDIVDPTEVATRGMAAYRAPSLFQPHRAKQAIRDAHEGRIDPLVGYWFGILNLPMARPIAQLGYDIVMLDWEHSACGVETMTSIVHEIQFMSEGKSMPIVRLPDHDHSTIAFAMDAGASIMCPQVDTVEQAENIVAAAKFGKASKGKRSVPPARLHLGFSDQRLDPSRSLWENLNDQAAIIIQIESEEGVHNLDAILTATGKHIDAVWLGSMDLRGSIGLDNMWGPEPEFLSLVSQYKDTLKKHDKPDSGLVLFGQWERAQGKCIAVTEGDMLQVMDPRPLQIARTNLARLKQQPATKTQLDTNKTAHT